MPARGSAHYHWKGGRRIAANGYVRLWVDGGGSGAYRYEHRVVAEQMLGRPLTRQEQVHHINGIKDDNRPENLRVLGIREHAALHEEHHFGPLLRWSRDHDACIDCGRTDRRHDGGGRCYRCHQKARRDARREGAAL